MADITQEDRQILKEAADKVADAVDGRVTGETTFRFVQPNITRFVETVAGGTKISIMVSLVAFSPDEGEIAIEYFERWGYSRVGPSEFDRISTEVIAGGNYAPDGSEDAEMVKDVKKDMERLDELALEEEVED